MLLQPGLPASLDRPAAPKPRLLLNSAACRPTLAGSSLEPHHAAVTPQYATPASLLQLLRSDQVQDAIQEAAALQVLPAKTRRRMTLNFLKVGALGSREHRVHT